MSDKMKLIGSPKKLSIIKSFLYRNTIPEFKANQKNIDDEKKSVSS